MRLLIYSDILSTDDIANQYSLIYIDPERRLVLNVNEVHGQIKSVKSVAIPLENHVSLLAFVDFV